MADSLAATCTSYGSFLASCEEEEDEDVSVWVQRKRQNSNPYSFTSGHESADNTPPISPKAEGFALPESHKPAEEETARFSPRSAVKRNHRKLSLFSFNFTSKSTSGENKSNRFWRGISQPSLFAQPTTQNGNRFSATKSSQSTLAACGGSTGSLDSPQKYDPQPSVDGCGSIDRQNKVLREILQETLRLQFDSVQEYKREMCDRLAKNVSQLVKRRVEVLKESAGKKCKIVSLVYVGAIKGEGIAVASQALLESETDNFTVASYRNGHIFAVASLMVIPIEKKSNILAV